MISDDFYVTRSVELVPVWAVLFQCTGIMALQHHRWKPSWVDHGYLAKASSTPNAHGIKGLCTTKKLDRSHRKHIFYQYSLLPGIVFTLLLSGKWYSLFPLISWYCLQYWLQPATNAIMRWCKPNWDIAHFSWDIGILLLFIAKFGIFGYCSDIHFLSKVPIGTGEPHL